MRHVQIFFITLYIYTGTFTLIGKFRSSRRARSNSLARVRTDAETRGFPPARARVMTLFQVVPPYRRFSERHWRPSVAPCGQYRRPPVALDRESASARPAMDGTREFRKERALTSFTGEGRETRVSLSVDPGNLSAVHDPEARERYAAAIERVRERHDPGDAI
jgi:hypothetical protein